MSIQSSLKEYYASHRVPNPINFTLTQKQIVDGQRINDEIAQQNFRHFRKLLNTHLFKNAYKRHGRQLSMLVVSEADATHRHHLHAVIERPQDMSTDHFVPLVMQYWTRTRFGYNQYHFEEPASADREVGWINYCLKKRTKADLASSIDWVNSTCFELS